MNSKKIIILQQKLLREIKGIVDDALSSKQADDNLTTTQSNWEIGKRLVVTEQSGEERAAYGKDVLGKISSELNQRYGRGYGLTSLRYMRRLFRFYKKKEINSKLAWTHYRILVQIADDKQRENLEKQAIKLDWNKRQLEDQG